MQRERDRVSARLDTLTQECSEAKEVAQSKEHQLQGRLDQCQAGYGSVDGELSKCKSSLLEANSAKAQCSSEVSSLGDGQRDGGIEGRTDRGRKGGRDGGTE